MSTEYNDNIGRTPEIEAAAYVAPSAVLRGDVALAREASVWHCAVLRADIAPIRVGARTNVQDGAILHVADDLPCVIGDDVTIGHAAVVHACRIGDRCLIGMGAIILNGTVVGDECIIGAGALIPGGKTIPARSLVLGNPGRVVRSVTDEEVEGLRAQARTYIELARATAEFEARAARSEGQPSGKGSGQEPL